MHLAKPLTASLLAEEKSNFNGIDLIKFFCAILVVVIHVTPFPGDVSKAAKSVNMMLQYGVCRVAVPFYFVCSGFFLFRKTPDVDAIKKYCYKMLSLMGIWYVLLFVGGKVHLWYLGATVVAVVLVSLCYRLQMKQGWILLLAIGLYIIGLLGDSYHGLVAPLTKNAPVSYVSKIYRFVFKSTRNGAFMGFIFVFMGASFAKSKVILKPLPAALGFAASMAGLLAEMYLLVIHDVPIGYNMYIFLLPAVYCLFSFAYGIQLKDRPIYKHLRNMGLLVYLLHLLVNYLVYRLLYTISGKMYADLQNYLFFIYLAATLLVAAGIEWLSGRKHFKWINWLLVK